MTPHVAHSPILLPEVYSKITERSSKAKNSKSKENKKIIHLNKNNKINKP